MAVGCAEVRSIGRININISYYYGRKEIKSDVLQRYTLIDIEAQEYAKGFYESVGFKQSSDTFILDGIPHIKMTWKK